MELDSNISRKSEFLIGSVLLSIQGATKNLREALENGNSQIILIRRRELHLVLQRGELFNNKCSPIISIMAFRLLRNLKSEVLIANSLIYDASLVLSQSLSLA
ncbi:Uncharacterised protein [Legionella bozemanae]|uniref:Uncharacterized protein n=1 Tax=Legionella bozemanae TaxID=447 RepID=A0A0W0RPZ8_LEGBO|nr:hypothetical protein Lboz_1794 [Legionella bozemanae]STP14091.1 Uncharacterised protein [Legionella bozemanae]